MTATSLDLSQIRSDALSYAATFRNLIGLGSSATLNAGSANGVATLDALGKLAAAQIPDISLISYLGSVASQSAMLALSGQQGDWCVRSDLSTTWVITGSDPTLLANWTQLSYPSVPVQSVFGRTGAVVGVSTDYSAVGITNTAIGASNPSTGAFTTLSAGAGTFSGNITASGPNFGVNIGFGSTCNIQHGSGDFVFVSRSLYVMGMSGHAPNGMGPCVRNDGGYCWSSGTNMGAIDVDLRLTRDAANTLAQRNGTNKQRFNLYGTYDSNGANYRRLYLDSTTAGEFKIGVEGAGTGANNNTLTISNGLSSVWFNSGINVVDLHGSSYGINLGNSNALRADTAGIGITHIGNGISLGSGRSLSWSSTTNWYDTYDLRIARNSAGQLDIRGDSGLRIRNLANTADAPVTASALSLTDTWNSNVSVTGASGTGTTVTLTFSSMTTAFPVGSTIVVSSVNPSGYNGTFTVTASTTTSVSYANATTGAYVSGGNIKQLFTALKVNVTDTSSDAGSLLADLQVGGVSKLSANKDGNVIVNKLCLAGLFNLFGWAELSASAGTSWDFKAYAYQGLSFDGQTTSLALASTMKVAWTAGLAANARVYDLALHRDAAGILAQRNSTNAQTFRLYRTADGSPGSNYERLALSSTTYSGGVYNTILCETAGTGADNINLVLGPAGTGAILAQVPDGTATGGNARGQYAVDLQTVRTANTQVASGNYALVIGSGNTASSDYAIAIGKSNSVSNPNVGGPGTGPTSIAIGDSCVVTSTYRTAIAIGGSCQATKTESMAFGSESWATGNYAIALGTQARSTGTGAISLGVGMTASGNWSVGLGYYCTTSATNSFAVGADAKADRYGMMARSSGIFGTAGTSTGDAQFALFTLRIKTTDATATTLMLDGSTTRLTIPSGKVFAFVAKISGIKSDGSAVAFYTRKGAIKNVGGTTSLVGSIETIGTDTEDNTSTDVAITADDTNDALQINVTGIAAETWRWVAVVEGVEIGYGT